MSEVPAYKSPNLPVKARVDDLIARMTLEEKIGQMTQLDWREGIDNWDENQNVGSVFNLLGDITNQLQAKAEQTRLGIPILFGIDAIHGHGFWHGSTVFPTQLALAGSWNEEMVTLVGRVTAVETACTGVRWTFSPMLDTARDLRWGRIDETFGEDAYLNGVLGAALVRGYQGDDLSAPDAIAACGKHYAGYSETQGGRDASEADLSRRRMRSIFLKPFQAASAAGCATFMAGYHAIDGIPCTANHWLLTDVLRGEWGFEGFVVSDYNNVGYMHELQQVYATMEEAAQAAVEAGNDMAMQTPAFYEAALAAARSGKLDAATIDEACRRILKVKFELGLFDANRYPDLSLIPTTIGSTEHRDAALEAACQSIVLLKNAGDLLPLRGDLTRIAVIGPNADDVKAQLGDWVSWEKRGDSDGKDRPRESTITLLDGIRARAGANCQVDYARGCDVINAADETIDEAVALARDADVVILAVGDNRGNTGERRDRANLDLSGAQERLVEAVVATGTPTVVVLVNSKPLSIPWIAEHVPAVVEAWNPGSLGGAAVASILFGDRNPGAKLTISFPVHVGQQPVYYDQIPGWHVKKYVDMPEDPLYAFGFGLSYTTFAYSDLRVMTKTLDEDAALQVEVTVKNTGSRVGTEVVQLYTHDLFSSLTTPIKELKTFERIELAPGEQKIVWLSVPYAQLAMIDASGNSVVEPGDFEVMVGSSSRDVDLLKDTFTVR